MIRQEQHYISVPDACREEAWSHTPTPHTVFHKNALGSTLVGSGLRFCGGGGAEIGN